MFPLHSRISHQICDFLFFILEFDLMILDLTKGALSVSEAMNLDFTRRESIRRVLPLYISSFFLSHPVIPIYVLLFHGKQQNNTFCTAGRQLLLIQIHRCLLCTWSIASSRKKSLFEFHPLGQSVGLTRNTISQQRRLFPAVTQHQPLSSRGHNNKSMMLLQVLPPPVVPGSHSRKQETWEWALGRHIHQGHLITLRLLPPCDSAWTGTEPLYHPTQRAVLRVGSSEHQGWEFRDLERLLSHEAYLSIKTWN